MFNWQWTFHIAHRIAKMRGVLLFSRARAIEASASTTSINQASRRNWLLI